MAKTDFVASSKRLVLNAAIVSLTDSSGGTAGDTIVDVPATYTEATLANQLASLTAKVNAILTALRDADIILP